MKKDHKKAIEKYQCPGCMSGCKVEECFSESEVGIGCGNHRAGTAIFPIGKMFLGMPKGFSRLGVGLGGDENMPLIIFDNFKQKWEYDMWNIPVWKHRNKLGHTLVRGMSPRTNMPFLHVILEDCLDKIDCLEISEEDIKNMD